MAFLFTGSARSAPIPVIYDTDIGTDIDDTWALALLLASPELDLKLVVTDTGDTRTRAEIAARFLERAGRTDIPVGIGVHEAEEIPIHQAGWVADYDLHDYPGQIHEDGVQAMIDLIMESDGDIVLLAVGPVPNIQEALKRNPAIAEKVRVVAMSGSVDEGYNGDPDPDPEYNVKRDAQATAAMYSAGWDLLIAPLDTAGKIQLKGDRYQRLLQSNSPLVQPLLENYRVWARQWGRYNPEVESSTLFDALAVALISHPDEFCEIESVRLEVTSDGYTRRSDAGSPVRAALRWKDQAAFERLLVERLSHR
ncbi:MAG: nucleoside hydrolase [Acidobacteriota bacterium]